MGRSVNVHPTEDEAVGSAVSCFVTGEAVGVSGASVGTGIVVGNCVGYLVGLAVG